MNELRIIYAFETSPGIMCILDDTSGDHKVMDTGKDVFTTAEKHLFEQGIHCIGYHIQDDPYKVLFVTENLITKI